MNYPKIDKYDCDHCERRNMDHGTLPCLNIDNTISVDRVEYLRLIENYKTLLDCVNYFAGLNMLPAIETLSRLK